MIQAAHSGKHNIAEGSTPGSSQTPIAANCCQPGAIVDFADFY